MESTDLPFLSSFKIFQRFHCFYYSRINEETFFLLNKNKHGAFSHFKGKLDELDPAILFSVGRKLIKISCGLFMRQNLMLFADDAISPENLRDMVQLCKPQLQTVSTFLLLLSLIYFSLNFLHRNSIKNSSKMPSKT